ncbi:MAG: NADH-quinone oxidoreductase subunit J [Burkholderiales bacterium]
MTSLPTFLFYAFASILLFASVRVITSRNPVHAALFLVLAFFTAAALWLLLQAEFLAIVLVLVYVGAVMVLFLFVVMMLDIDIEELRKGFLNYLPLGILVGGLMVFEMGSVLWSKALIDQAAPVARAANYSNTKELGRLIYTDYVYPFELASVILLVAIVAAIALTMRKRKNTKSQDPSEQVKVRRKDRVRIVNMASEARPVSKAPVEPVTDPKQQ